MKKVETVPGMSDHLAVTIELDTVTVKYSRKKPRTVYLYKKGDMSGVRRELEDFLKYLSLSPSLHEEQCQR